MNLVFSETMPFEIQSMSSERPFSGRVIGLFQVQIPKAMNGQRVALRKRVPLRLVNKPKLQRIHEERKEALVNTEFLVCRKLTACSLVAN